MLNQKILTSVCLIIVLPLCGLKSQSTIKSYTDSSSSFLSASSCKLIDNGYLIAYKAGNINNIVRYDSYGVIKWQKAVLSVETSSITNLYEDNAKNILALGEDTAGGDYYSLIKLSATGNLIWSRQLSKNGLQSYDLPTMKCGANNSIYVLSCTYDKSHIYVVDSLGNLLWSKTFYIDDVTFKNPSFDFEIMNDGGILCSGKSENDLFLMRLNNFGNLVFSKRFKDYGNFNTHVRIVKKMNDGNFLIGGFRGESVAPYRSGLFLMKSDAFGNIIRYRFYYDSLNINNFIPYSASETSTGNIVVSGYGGALFFASFNNNFDLLSYKKWNSVSNAQCGHSCFDTNINEVLIFCSNYNSTLYSLRTNINSISFCEMENVFTIGNYSITISPPDISFFANVLSGPVVSEANINTSTANVINMQFYCGDSETLLSSSGTALQPVLTIYPNPVSVGKQLKINSSEKINSLQLRNSYGQIVFEENRPDVSITIPELSPGIYLVALRTNTSLSTHPLLVTE